MAPPDSDLAPTNPQEPLPPSTLQVSETYDAGALSPPSTLGDDSDPASGDAPRLIGRAVATFGGTEAYCVNTFLNEDGAVFTSEGPLPLTHYLHDDFASQHAAALETAIVDHAESRGISVAEMRGLVALGNATRDNRSRIGFRDVEPKLLPGTTFHERVASLGPDHDDEDAYPGFRVQVLAQKVQPPAPKIERLSNIRRSGAAKMVGLMDQPHRVKSNMACLSALLKVGNSQAYMLFDTGSNTDSITPEYAHATDSPRIKLEEQVILQLGCVGSRSKINYGTRAAIDFGGIRGHLYLDQVNLDRYDGIIGTPFMNRHGLVLDFGKREVRFPNGHVIHALSALDEAAIILQRHERPARATAHSTSSAKPT